MAVKNYIRTFWVSNCWKHKVIRHHHHHQVGNHKLWLATTSYQAWVIECSNLACWLQASVTFLVFLRSLSWSKILPVINKKKCSLIWRADCVCNSNLRLGFSFLNYKKGFCVFTSIGGYLFTFFPSLAYVSQFLINKITKTEEPHIENVL